MFGHSFGGAAAGEACWIDSRLDACANLDGIFLGPMRLSGGRSMDKPFMTLLDEYYPLGNEPSPENFFERQSGPAYQLTIAGITHSGFNDLGYVLRRRFGPLPRFDSQFGSLGSGRAIEIIRAYNGAFFDKHLRGQTASLLDGPSAAFPEVAFRSK